MRKIREVEIRAIVGHQLRLAREKAELTLREAEEISDSISAEELNKVELGLYSIRCCDIYKLLKAYSFPKDQVFFFCTFLALN